jgi:hypothetical protein
MRKTSLLAVALGSLALLLGVGGCVSGDAATQHAATPPKPTWHGATAASRWSGWNKREVLPGGAAAVRVRGVDATAYTVRPGDVPGKNGERSEVSASVTASGAVEGNVARYRWSTWFPTGFRPTPDSTWTIFTQFHESAADGCHPNVVLQVNTRDGGEQLRLTTRGGRLDAATCRPATERSWDFATLQRDHWYQFDLTVGWSASPRDGFVQLDVDGATLVPRTAAATLYRGQSAYLKQGLYRQPADFTTTVLQSAVTRTRP